MARTSKKKQAEATVVKKSLKTYSVGIYARLSVDSNEIWILVTFPSEVKSTFFHESRITDLPFL